MDREDSNSPCNVIFIGPQQTPRAVRFVDASVSVLVHVREDGRKYAAAWSNEEGKWRKGEGRGDAFEISMHACFISAAPTIEKLAVVAAVWKPWTRLEWILRLRPLRLSPPNRSACHLWRVELHVGRPILKKCRRMSVPLL